MFNLLLLFHFRQSNKDYFSSIPWLSKSTTTTEDTPTDHLDPELRNFAESFRGKVVIEIIDPIKFFKTSRPGDESTLNESNSSKKNFKKFKKVRCNDSLVNIVMAFEMSISVTVKSILFYLYFR